MTPGAVFRAGSERCLVPQARRTATTWERLRGLLGRPPLARGEGLLIAPCPSVHTVGMGYPIDIAFLDRTLRVVHRVCALPPWRFAGCARAYAALELSAGALDEAGIVVGDLLEWRGV